MPYLIWPLLFGFNVLAVWGLLQLPLSYDAVFALGLCVAMISMAVAEMLAPHRRDWRPDIKELRVNGLYFVINAAVSNSGSLLAALIVLPRANNESNLPLVLQVPLVLEVLLAILVSGFFTYWWHRFGHRNAWLWRLHGVHHVPKKIFMLNNNTVHSLDLFASAFIGIFALLVTGFSTLAITLAMLFNSFQGFFTHMNANVKLGWLGYVVMGPQHHRFHHSIDNKEALNYCVELAVWDQVFGTFLYRPGSEPAGIGIQEPNRFPSAVAIWRSMLSPFR